MKKIALAFSVIFLITSCNKSKNEIESPRVENKITFEVNEATEFLITAFNLAVEEETPDEYMPCETDYVKRLNTYFANFKTHPFLDFIYDNVNSGTDFSSVGLLITNLNTMEFNSEINTEFLKQKLYTDDLSNFRKLAADYYKVTNFNSFYNSNTNNYINAVSKLKNQVETENLTQKIQDYYNDNRMGLEFKIFVALTNNNESKAIDFYDNYNPNVRALILGNFCDTGSESTDKNEILELEDYQGILCHEISHLYTTSVYLDKYIGNIEDFRNLFDDDLTDSQIKDNVDHMLIRPLQSILTKRIFNDLAGNNYYSNQPNTIEKDIYLLFSGYDPSDSVPFENYYKKAIELIRAKA